MADKKITQLTNITGANLVDADEFVVVDISADETKAITLGELKEAFDSESGFVRSTAATGQANMPAGTTAQRTGSPVAGALRFNSTDVSFEGYDGTEWGSIGGGAEDGVFYENEQSVSSSYTVAATKNAMTAGPITINDGVTVTIETGGRWVVL